MILLLHIENIAVVEKADIEFRPGLNVLTGETGAGKSIVIDALSVITGGRASKDIIRTGADYSSVTAVFEDVIDGAWFEENSIERDEDKKIFLIRRISADGRNTCKVNGTPVSVQQLRELGGLLIDIHGQNDGRKLLDENAHLAYLDLFGTDTKALESYKTLYRELLEKDREIEKLSIDDEEKERKIDTIKYQINEIESAQIRPGEQEELSKRREILKNFSKLMDSVEGAFCALDGGEDGEGAVSLLSTAEHEISGVSKYFDELLTLTDRLRDLRYNAQDVLDELLGIRGGLDFSPNELDEIETRLDVLRRVMRKYGGTESEVLDFYSKIAEELSDMEFSSEKIIKLEKERKKIFAETKKQAESLSEIRKQAAQSLQQKVMSELSGLSMPNVRFEVKFMQISGELPLNSTGQDEVRFYMSANAGEELGKISHIASGGELSRIMLALKNVLSENDGVATVVFDEVDAGVSGVAAQRVGEKLSRLARGKQVLCVTHLPQIAVMADTHFEILKTVESGRTFTQIGELDMEGRMQELARLTGGENITIASLTSAREQLDAADAFKAKR